MQSALELVDLIVNKEVLGPNEQMLLKRLNAQGLSLDIEKLRECTHVGFSGMQNPQNTNNFVLVGIGGSTPEHTSGLFISEYGIGVMTPEIPVMMSEALNRPYFKGVLHFFVKYVSPSEDTGAGEGPIKYTITPKGVNMWKGNYYDDRKFEVGKIQLEEREERGRFVKDIVFAKLYLDALRKIR